MVGAARERGWPGKVAVLPHVHVKHAASGDAVITSLGVHMSVQ